MMWVAALEANAQTIFFEDFNNEQMETTLPTGWTVYGDDAENLGFFAPFNQSWQLWYPDSTGYHQGGTSKDGEAMSVTRTEPRCNRWLITPRIDLPTDTIMSLIFKHRCETFGQFPVKVSTTGTDPEDFTTEIGWITLQHEKQTAHCSLADFAGQSVYIAFVNNVQTGSCANYVAIDDVEVLALPSANLVLESVDLPERGYLGETVTATLHVSNRGNNYVLNLDYSYRIGENEAVVNTANRIDICPYMTKTIDVSFVPTELGVMTIEFEVSRPDGHEDSDNSDNSLTYSLPVIERPVGISDVEENNMFAIYPNPVTDRVIIQAKNGGMKAEKAWVSNLLGVREMVSLAAEGDGRYSADLSNLPAGIYYLSITAGGATSMQKIVKMAR